ncbi:MAG: hypothetical protein ACLUKN_03695 [Bacilli bacterium]
MNVEIKECVGDDNIFIFGDAGSSTIEGAATILGIITQNLEAEVRFDWLVSDYFMASNPNALCRCASQFLIGVTCSGMRRLPVLLRRPSRCGQSVRDKRRWARWQY